MRRLVVPGLVLAMLLPRAARAEESAAPHRIAESHAFELFVAARDAWPSYTAKSTDAFPTPVVKGQRFQPGGHPVAIGAGYRLGLVTEDGWNIQLFGVRLGGLTDAPATSRTLDASPSPVTYAIHLDRLYGEIMLPGVGYSVYGAKTRFGGSVEPSFHFYGVPEASATQGALATKVDTTDGGSFELGLEAHACYLLGHGDRSHDWLCAVVGSPMLRTDPVRTFDGITFAIRLEHHGG